ncbi:WhiB family transcriptional regulator [Actinomadura decatromicini]|uniref:Transcriptional regulator WhiB n=2 Tax=Actinomadura decatromicini TaxID=2604572 RepID=A0A5D3FBJ1_9ACTN|nr:WhiB family transcriptional regulator [Actinomadura decatromicini]
MPAVEDTVEAAERREAATKAADLALQHPCELDPANNVTVCTHPDHGRDADWLRVALDVLALPGHDPYTDEPATAPTPPPRKPAPRPAASPGRPSFSWHDQAACRRMDLLLFFGPVGERNYERAAREREAAEVCMYCPVRDECLEWAFTNNEAHGVWGGLGEEVRQEARRKWLRRRQRNAA